MKFSPTRVDGAWLIEPEPIRDDRGFFARLWCEDALREHGLNAVIAQTNVGFSDRQGTLRGLHLQSAPHAEVKLVRCTRGAAFDVVVDLRPDSPTYCAWWGTTLNPENRAALYVPEGCATGYLTLTADTEVYYHTSAPYAPDAAWGVRWNDPTFAIEWPAEPELLSAQDRDWPLFER